MFIWLFILAEAAAVYCMENNLKEQALTVGGTL
jgi:hypothetical protein